MSLIYDPHLIGITETWLHIGIQSDEVFPSCNNVIRNDRASRGGGVAFLIKRTLKYESLPDISEHESAWCRLCPGETTLLIGAVYRARTNSLDFFVRIDAYLSAITNIRSRIVLMGDFNSPGVDWNSRIPGFLNRSHADLMLEIMVNHSLIQVVNCPTRIQDHYQSILGSIFLSDKTFNHDVTAEDGISDHKSVVAVLSGDERKIY